MHCEALLFLTNLLCSLLHILWITFMAPYIYDANHWFAEWFWLDWVFKNVWMLGHGPMYSEMTAELMCLTFGGIWCLTSRGVEDSWQELSMLHITKSCIFCHSSFQYIFGIDFFVLFRSWKVTLTDFCRAQHSFSRWLQLGGKPQNSIAYTLTRSQRGGRLPMAPPWGVRGGYLNKVWATP